MKDRAGVFLACHAAGSFLGKLLGKLRVSVSKSAWGTRVREALDWPAQPFNPS
ncbi:MAG: hypothetical protein ACLQU1_31440 [Bryobacteraceae bacterium]